MQVKVTQGSFRVKVELILNMHQTGAEMPKCSSMHTRVNLAKFSVNTYSVTFTFVANKVTKTSTNRNTVF